jgi:hypothetical protein
VTAAPLLRDPEREAELVADGYAVLPVLDADEVADLRAAYHDAVPGGGAGMLVEYTQADRRRMEAVARLLAPVWERHLDDLFVDHRVVFATFVVKYPDTGSAMFLHEDRTYVDERHHRSATLWIPLVDTGPAEANGNLQVVPGSQRLAVAPAGSNTPELFRP